jgi:hypothetical protein
VGVPGGRPPGRHGEFRRGEASAACEQPATGMSVGQPRGELPDVVMTLHHALIRSRVVTTNVTRMTVCR